MSNRLRDILEEDIKTKTSKNLYQGKLAKQKFINLTNNKPATQKISKKQDLRNSYSFLRNNSLLLDNEQLDFEISFDIEPTIIGNQQFQHSQIFDAPNTLVQDITIVKLDKSLFDKNFSDISYKTTFSCFSLSQKRKLPQLIIKEFNTINQPQLHKFTMFSLNNTSFSSPRLNNQSILLQPIDIQEKTRQDYIKQQFYEFQLVFGEKGYPICQYISFMKYQLKLNLEVNLHQSQPIQEILKLANQAILKLNIQ